MKGGCGSAVWDYRVGVAILTGVVRERERETTRKNLGAGEEGSRGRGGRSDWVEGRARLTRP